MKSSIELTLNLLGFDVAGGVSGSRRRNTNMNDKGSMSGSRRSSTCVLTDSPTALAIHAGNLWVGTSFGHIIRFDTSKIGSENDPINKISTQICDI